MYGCLFELYIFRAFTSTDHQRKIAKTEPAQNASFFNNLIFTIFGASVDRGLIWPVISRSFKQFRDGMKMCVRLAGGMCLELVGVRQGFRQGFVPFNIISTAVLVVV